VHNQVHITDVSVVCEDIHAYKKVFTHTHTHTHTHTVLRNEINLK